MAQQWAVDLYFVRSKESLRETASEGFVFPFAQAQKTRVFLFIKISIFYKTLSWLDNSVDKEG
jgi:hypothetical protein